MKGLILLAIVLATAAQAQQQAPCLRLSKIRVERNVLHQNGETEAHLTFQGKNCYVVTQSVSLGKQWPVVELDKEPEPGLFAMAFVVRASEFDQSRALLEDFRAQKISVALHLTATQDLPVGQHKVPALLRYKVIDAASNVSEETLAFDVSIKVDTPESVNSPHSEESGFVHGLKMVGEGIVIVPLLIAMLFWCTFGTGECPTC
jgi:hypothetical protein